MSKPIECNCPQGGGLPHIHRNPPYDTEGRLEMLRRLREERAVEVSRVPYLKQELGLDPTMSPNELERLASASNYFEICDLQWSHGDCENAGCHDETGLPREATVRVGRYNLCEFCADERDRGKPAKLVEPRRRLENLK